MLIALVVLQSSVLWPRWAGRQHPASCCVTLSLVASQESHLQDGPLWMQKAENRIGILDRGHSEGPTGHLDDSLGFLLCSVPLWGGASQRTRHD